MNKGRRKAIQDIIDTISDKCDELEILTTEEEDAYENLPENFQEGERGEEMEGYIDILEGCVSDLTDVCERLVEIVGEVI